MTLVKPSTEFMLDMFLAKVHLCPKSLPPLAKKGYFYLAQSIDDMAASVRNGDMVGNGDINFVNPLSKAVLTLHLAMCLFKIMEIVGNGDIVGIGDINFVTLLSPAVLILHLAWCLFRIMDVVGNGHIVSNGDINFVTPLPQAVFTFGNVLF